MQYTPCVKNTMSLYHLLYLCVNNCKSFGTKTVRK